MFIMKFAKIIVVIQMHPFICEMEMNKFMFDCCDRLYNDR